MRKIISALLFTMVVIVATQLSSCKKKEDMPPRSVQITGAWKQTQSGNDVNANGTWDEEEVATVASADAINLIFNNDGTGTAILTYLGFPLSGAITWTLTNNDNDLNVTVSLAGTPITTLSYTFISFAGNEFKVKDTSSPTMFSTFRKQ